MKTITKDGIEFDLQQDAYIDTDETYVAYAIGNNGRDYEITWEVKDYDCIDEGDACDWDRWTYAEI